MPSQRPRVLIIAGYFDWFSGYQETALAASLALSADTEILASDRVSPAFSDDHLSRLSIPRRYASGSTIENGVSITRMPVHEKRSMVWSNAAISLVSCGEFDLVIQVMPGQGMPFAATLARTEAVRVALYGDNSGMWSHLSRWQRVLKGCAFAASKGVLYALVNRKADRIYGYTPETLFRLAPFSGGKRMALLPLSFDRGRFFFSEALRKQFRSALSYSDEDVVIVTAGRFMERKRLETLVNAFRLLRKVDGRLKLHLVGADDGAYTSTLTSNLRADLELREFVKISPFSSTPELNGIFNASDVGVWPVLPAVTIQQSMGTGLLVVLPRNDWVGHLLGDKTGRYFRPDDDSQLVKRMAVAINTVVRELFRSSRATRACANGWLGADRMAASLLSDAGLSSRMAG